MKTKPKPWTSMSADERDALVVKKVLGWIDDPHHPILFWKESETTCRFKEGFSPSTSIAAAFEVVEKMREKGFCFGCWCVTPISSVMVGWVAGFNHGVHPLDRLIGSEIDGNFFASAESLPDAICLAALRAHGVDVE